MKIDTKYFSSRINKLVKNWEENTDSSWRGINAFVVVSGTKDEEIIYKKSSALQLWLFGAELENTIFVFLPRDLHIVTRSNEVNSELQLLLKSMQSQEGEASIPKLHIHKLEGDDDNNNNDNEEKKKYLKNYGPYVRMQKRLGRWEEKGHWENLHNDGKKDLIN